jgi:hypothetical protein
MGTTVQNRNNFTEIDMDLKQIEAKWQKKWEETGLYKFNRDSVKDKYYVLEMFSYPSGAKLHAGHFVSRVIYATRWDEENVNAQCAGCNLKQSNTDVEVIHKYEVALEAKFGKGTVDRLLAKKHTIHKLNRCQLEADIEYYKQKLKEYENA